jgi:phage-related baseplate assembly protein
MNTVIDLSLLPAPAVVEVLDYETLYAARKAGLVALFPADQQAEIAATLELESEPLAILLQENTLREMTLRQRINDAARGLMLAYAIDTDLDHLAALFNVQRLTITPADAENGVAAVMESDADLRRRVQLAPEGFSVAGPAGAYAFHALAADSRVRHVAVASPAPGEVLVTILARDGNGTAPDDLIAAVSAALGDESVRPLTDAVTVQSATPVAFNVTATITVADGPDVAVIRAAAVAALENLLTQSKRIGQSVALSAIYAALHQPGVVSVALSQPQGDVAVNPTQAAWCSGYMVNMEKTTI